MYVCMYLQKTEIMFVNCQPQNISVGEESPEVVEDFKYLGSYINKKLRIESVPPAQHLDSCITEFGSHMN